MQSLRLFPLLIPLLTGCVQSVHGDGPSSPPVPGGEVRLLEERPGSGRRAVPGDRIVVDFVGRYGSGEVWGEGPLTLIVGKGTYPGTSQPLQVGAVIRLQYLNNPNDTTARLVPFPGGDTENEAFLVRRDRGPIIVEHTVRKVCRPLKLFFLQTGLGPIEAEIGCWPIPRPALVGPRVSGLVVGGSRAIDPPPVERAAVDPSRYLDEEGLHRAAREGRPELVGWLLAHGKSVTAVDSFGFQPIHYVGWAQRPMERFVPAFETGYLAVVDTLLAHGAVIDAVVQPGRAAASMQATDFVGQTALGFSGPECADQLVGRLLVRGARPDAYPKGGRTALIDAAAKGCPETVQLLLQSGATVDLDPQGGGTPLERLISASAFHLGHLESARLLIRAGAKREVAAQRLADRLRDPGTGSFGFSNRPMARRIVKLLTRTT